MKQVYKSYKCDKYRIYIHCNDVSIMSIKQKHLAKVLFFLVQISSLVYWTAENQTLCFVILKAVLADSGKDIKAKTCINKASTN